MQETIYTPHSPLAAPRSLLRHLKKDLRIVLQVSYPLFVRNLKVQVRQSLLGYLWMLIPPLVAGLVWSVLGQARIISQPALSVPYPVFVLAGVFLWQGFVEALQCPLQQLSAMRGTLAKVRIPHEAFVVAGFGVVLLNSALRLLVLAAVMAWFRMPPTTGWLLVPLGIAALLGLGLGLGWLLALPGLLYSDVSNALAVGLNLWFLVTPVVYVAPPALASWLALNPVTPLLTTTRDWLLSGAAAPPAAFGLTALLAGLVLLSGWQLYRLAQPHLTARL